MAKTRFIQSSFNSGVLSPLLKGRTDLEQYYKSLEVGDNVVLLPQGALKRRPGTEYIDLGLPVLLRNTVLPTMPNGGTAANINDGSDLTSTATTTNISTLNPYVVAKTDLGSAKYIEFVDVRGVFLTAGSSTEFQIQWSDDDVSYTSATTFLTLGVGTQDVRRFVGVTKRYWRLARIGATDLSTAKVTLSEFNLFEKTTTLSEVKLKDFSVTSADDGQYLLAFTDGNCRVFDIEFNIHRADIKMPYTSAQLSEIRETQSESVMLIVHEDVATQRLVNLGNSTDWSLDEPPFINIPQYDYDDTSSPSPTSDVHVLTFTLFVAGDTFQIDIEGVLSKNITFAGDANTAEQTSTAFNIQKNIQDMPVVADTGVSVSRTGVLAYTITIAAPSTKAFKLFSGFPTSGTASKSIAFTHTTTGVSRSEDIWSSTRGYPKTACYYEGRLVFGGTKSKPQTLLMSKAGSAFDFEIDEGDDDDAIFTTISSRKLNDIVDVYPGRNLQIFTSGAEFTINISPITPSTISIPSQTSQGAFNIEPKEIDGATLFIERNGKTLNRFLFNFNEDAYSVDDISVLSPEMIKNPLDMSVLGGTNSDDANWVFIVNNDGGVTILNTLRSQDINGFTSWTTSGFITNSSVVDRELYMVNKRTVNGTIGHYIERWSFDYLMDNSIKVTNVAPLSTVTGLTHLEGETVSIVADGSVLTPRLVSGGSIALTSDEEFHVNFEVGLPFIPSFKTMPVNTNVGSGQNSMRLKKLVRMNIRVINTSGLAIEGEIVSNRNLGLSVLDTAPNSQTGIIDDVYNLTGWDRDSMPLFTCPDPTPFTILNIEYEIESS